MKLSSLFSISALTLSLVATGCHQAASPAVSLSWSQKGNEAEIRQWMDTWVKDFDAGDVDAIMTLYSPKVLVYDVVPPIQYEGGAAYRKDWAEFFASYQMPIQVEVHDLRINTSGDLAFITCLEHVTGTLKTGQKASNWLRVTTGLRKVDGKWLDVHDHASIPVDLATGKGQLDIQP